MKYTAKKNCEVKCNTGSALILAVVLSTLLAIVGVLFLMAARVNQMGTSAISQNKELDFAVNSVVADLSQQLALDVPGIVDPNQEYYDYPDVNNAWLASLEPYELAGKYYWHQISDISGQLAGKNRDIRAVVVSQYASITDTNNPPADTDGDGVADSRWYLLTGISSSSGKPIYAAVRVIDNGAMLNVNTGFKFNPNDSNAAMFDIDGKKQTQINIMALAGRAGAPPTSNDELNLLYKRANNGVGVNPYDLQSYLRNVVWNYGEPNGPYTPFDMSDELEMRYRFMLNNTGIDTRLETWSDQFRRNSLSTPVTSGGADLDAWFLKALNNGSADPNYSYRHIASTYNMDRIINPAGWIFNNGKMVNINTAEPQLLYNAIKMSIQNREPNTVLVERLAAQLAVNIVDLRDKDADVTALTINAKTYYGFEVQPFISEIGFKISDSAPDKPENNYFAVEIYNPFKVDIPLRDFKIEICDANSNVADSVDMTGYILKAQSRFVVTNNSNATKEFNLNSVMSSGSGRHDPNLVLAKYVLVGAMPPAYQLSKRYDLRLVRKVANSKLPLDKQVTQDAWLQWSDANNVSKFYSRSDTNWNIVYQELKSSSNTLGANNASVGIRKNYNLANSIDFFISVGDIARTLTIGPSVDANDMIGAKLAVEPDEYKIRLDLKNPVFSNIFRYLTVIDPTEYGLSQTETRIKGRININTAPWFVMAQLPWMQSSVARDIVPFRDSFGAFDTIGDLMQVPQMGFYTINAHKDTDLDRWPDLTPQDGAVSDFEERDVIFSRISNLITVRSDVFTAYILVRIGLDGPQKRAIAILDRSRVTMPVDKVRLLALQPVPDPR
ncbi:MAG: helix-hairpin-helix domain-containing protein [Sedimentisphaerales bacterium]|nr:helix-hairpin-helix domain-containing protein [Sedimentisphaerales bacterium]